MLKGEKFDAFTLVRSVEIRKPFKRRLYVV